MDFKLELVLVPVSDIDRSKGFYSDKTGFNVDVDFRAGEDFRIVQLTPPGSACSITIIKNPKAAGSLQGLHLVVKDIDAARAELVKRGADVSEVYHYAGAGGTQTAGPDPERRDYNSYFSFADPDGNGWLVQEVPSR